MRRVRAERGTSAFSWLPHTRDFLSSRRRPVGISSVIFSSFPLVRGRCVVRGGIRDPPFFWQFVKGAHGTADCLKRVVLLASPAPSTRSSPSSWRHSLPPFLLLAGDRTMNGPHYFFRRFSYSSRENTWKKVIGRRTRGTGPLRRGRFRGLFLALCGSGATFK